MSATDYFRAVNNTVLNIDSHIFRQLAVLKNWSGFADKYECDVAMMVANDRKMTMDINTVIARCKITLIHDFLTYKPCTFLVPKEVMCELIHRCLVWQDEKYKVGFKNGSVRLTSK